MTQKTSLIRSLNVFAMFFCVVLLEEIMVGTSKTYSMISCIIGIIGMLIYLRVGNKHFEDIGLIFAGKKFWKGVGLAAAVAALSIGIVILAEEIFFRLLGYKGWFFSLTQTVFFYTKNNAVIENGIMHFLKWSVVGIFVCLIRAIFFESFFRGLMIRLNLKAFHFKKSNLIQCVLFTVWFIVVPTKYLINQSEHKKMLTAGIVLVLYIVYEFLVAFRLGLVRRSTGSLWCCIFNFWFFDLFNTFFYTFPYFPQEMTSYYKMLRAIVVQLVALGFTYIYYRVKMKKVAEKRKAALEAAEDDADNFEDEYMFFDDFDLDVKNKANYKEAVKREQKS